MSNISDNRHSSSGDLPAEKKENGKKKKKPAEKPIYVRKVTPMEIVYRVLSSAGLLCALPILYFTSFFHGSIRLSQAVGNLLENLSITGVGDTNFLTKFTGLEDFSINTIVRLASADGDGQYKKYLEMLPDSMKSTAPWLYVFAALLVIIVIAAVVALIFTAFTRKRLAALWVSAAGFVCSLCLSPVFQAFAKPFNVNLKLSDFTGDLSGSLGDIGTLLGGLGSSLTSLNNIPVLTVSLTFINTLATLLWMIFGLAAFLNLLAYFERKNAPLVKAKK